VNKFYELKKTKETFIIGFALFSGFFGAGNLILPPFLGFHGGNYWWLVAFGFIISATVIPLLSLLAHARLQGTMLDFGRKVSPVFSMIFCLSVYVVAICLPVPRTASVTHEMAIQPFFGTSALLTSSIYFFLVFLFVMNRNNVLNILGKILTPLIIIILVAIIIIGFVFAPDTINASLYKTPFIYGLLEGYQTYDAIGGLLMGGVVVISLNLKGYTSFNDKRKIITKAGLIAATGLFSIYAGLIALGAFYNAEFDVEISRTALLSGLSLKTLGGIGTVFLSVLVALACFTTAVTVIVGTADFFKGIFKGSKTVYGITALLSCLIGILVGQFDVHYIIDIAVPALFFIYPVTIVLIFLNVLPERFTRPIVFKWVVFMAILFSLPDFLQSIGISESIRGITQFIPLSKFKMGWVLPAFTTLILMNLLRKRES
jgi:LIVCS family branched-chain amino acid:cation transporter